MTAWIPVREQKNVTKTRPKIRLKKTAKKFLITTFLNILKKLSTSEQAIDQNPDYEPSSIYDSMENDQKDIRVMFSSSIW